MLREIGKRDQSVKEKFLKKHYKGMSCAMLRYAIEKFHEKGRKRYRLGLILAKRQIKYYQKEYPDDCR